MIQKISNLIAKLKMLRYTVLDYNDWAVSFCTPDGETFISMGDIKDAIKISSKHSVNILKHFIIVSSGQELSVYVQGKKENVTRRFKKVTNIGNSGYVDSEILYLKVNSQGRFRHYLLNYKGKIMEIPKISGSSIKIALLDEDHYIVSSYGYGYTYDYGEYNLDNETVECVVDKDLRIIS